MRLKSVGYLKESLLHTSRGRRTAFLGDGRVSWESRKEKHLAHGHERRACEQGILPLSLVAEWITEVASCPRCPADQMCVACLYEQRVKIENNMQNRVLCVLYLVSSSSQK